MTTQCQEARIKLLLVPLLLLCLSVATAQCSPPSGLSSPSEDEETWGLAGEHEHVKLLSSIGGSSEYPAWSPDGTQIAFQHIEDRLGQSDVYAPRDIYVIKADGTEARRMTQSAQQQVSCEHPSWAPDSRRLVCACGKGGDFDLYVLDTVTAELTQLTHEPGGEKYPAWSPDGAYIAFVSNTGGRTGGRWRSNAYLLRVDGGEIKPLASILDASVLAWSPDSQALAFTSWQDPSSQASLCTVRISDGNETCWKNSYCLERGWSPDGSTIACAATAKIETFNLRTEEVVTLLDTQYYVLSGLSWSPDSRQLVFAAGLMPGAANDLYILAMSP